MKSRNGPERTPKKRAAADSSFRYPGRPAGSSLDGKISSGPDTGEYAEESGSSKPQGRGSPSKHMDATGIRGYGGHDQRRR